MVYAEVATWQTHDAIEAEARVASARRRQRLDCPAGPGDERLLDEAQAHIGEPAHAEVIAVAGGVVHRLVRHAPWWMELELALLQMEDGLDELSEEAAEELDAEREEWAAQAEREAHDHARLMAEVTGLEATLRADETFLATCTTDTARRAYAHRMIREATGVTELPSDVRGAASAVAEDAWRWWRAEGRPAREAALREQLPMLAVDASLVGTLEEHKRAARTLLHAVDPLAVSTELIDALARASQTGR